MDMPGLPVQALPPPPEPSKFSVKQVALAFGAVIVLALSYAGFNWYSRSRENAQALSGGRQLITAPSGKAVSDLPPGLNLAGNDPIAQSYSLRADGVSQPVVVYTSGKSLADAVGTVRSYLTANGWSILSQADPHSSPTFFYAMRGNFKEELNIAFEQIGNQVRVTEAYVKRQ